MGCFKFLINLAVALLAIIGFVNIGGLEFVEKYAREHANVEKEAVDENKKISPKEMAEPNFFDYLLKIDNNFQVSEKLKTFAESF